MWDTRNICTSSAQRHEKDAASETGSDARNAVAMRMTLDADVRVDAIQSPPQPRAHNET